jgi:hemolysin III
LVWKISWEARPAYRGRLHAIAAFVAPAAAAAVITRATPGRNRIAAAVYGAGLCGLFAVSGAYHRLSRSRKWAERMRLIDHSMIYVMIAGTWTPIVVAVLPPKYSRLVLGAVWGSAASAIGAKVAFLDEKNRAGSWFYPVLGLAGAGLAPAVAKAAGKSSVALLSAGGAAYIGGAIIFATRKPNPWPKKFGYHEIFHTAVVAGVASHFAVIWKLVGPRKRR